MYLQTTKKDTNTIKTTLNSCKKGIMVTSEDMIDKTELTAIKTAENQYIIVIIDSENIFKTLDTEDYLLRCVEKYFFNQIIITGE